ncbi:MAG: hypothetical protein P8Y72_11620 [Anaerolineales bacterium]
MNTKNKKHLPFLITICAILFLLFSNPAAGQVESANVIMEATAAYNGNFKYGEWLPIWVKLSNTGPDIEGLIQIEISQSGGNITFAKEVSLPNGSRKELTLSVLPNNFSRELEIKFISKQSTLLSNTISVNPNQNDSIIIGISASKRGGLSSIGNIETGDSFRNVVLFDLNIQQLPDRAREMESINTIIINDIDTSQLNNEQQTALENWVSNGGHLIIGGGPGLEKSILGLPNELINFSVEQNKQLDEIPSLEQFGGNDPILVQGPFTISPFVPNGGSNLINENGISILHQWGFGKGKITLSSADLSGSPFNAWGGTALFWEKVLSSELFFPQWMPRDIALRQMRANSMAYPLSNLPALDIPSIKALGIILIIYIGVIGPTNYIFLRWKNKLQYAWVTFPLLTIVFTAGTFGLAYSLRGNDVIVNKLSVIDLGHTGIANIDSYVGIFSPAQTSYQIQVDGDQLLSPSFGGYYDPWSSSTFNPAGQITFVQGNPSKVIGLSVNQWSMQSFNVEGIRFELGTIDSTLTIGKNIISGTLVNDLPFTIEDAVLIIGNNTLFLGDLVPKNAEEISSQLDTGEINIFGNPITYQILETAYPGSGFDYQRDFETKRAILDNYFQPYGYWIGPNYNYENLSEEKQSYFQTIYLIGWTTNTPPDIQLNGQLVSQNSLGLIVSQIPVMFDPGQFNIPPSLLSGKIIEQPSNSGYCGSSTTNIYMDYGTAKFEFLLPPILEKSTISKLSLFFNEDISQWAQEDPGFSLWIYNWDENAWVQLTDIVNGINEIEKPASLINEDGSIRVQIDKENRNSGGCIYVALGLEGSTKQ